MTKFLIGIALICLVTDAFAQSFEWGYDGGKGAPPSQWYKGYKVCGGKKQSPIDINMASMVYLPHVTPFQFTGPTVGGVTLQNYGYAIQCNLDSSWDYYVTGGPLSYTYKLGQFHIHYGSNNSRGSEHTVNGRGLPAEIHFVFYNSDLFAGIYPAHNKPNGLAVIGAFVDIGSSFNVEMGKLTNVLHKVKYYGDTVRIPSIDLTKLVPSLKYFATYHGSLTTPPCTESVTWTVLNDHIQMNEAQINEFRTQLYSGKADNPGLPMANNYRPVEALNARKVFFN